MLPFHILRSSRIDRLPRGSFVLAAANLPAPIFIGIGFEGQPWAMFREDEAWCFDSLDHFGADGLWVDDIKFEVEPTSYLSLSSQRAPVGSLIFAKGDIAIALPANFGTIPGRIGQYDHHDGDRDCAFASWRAVKVIDNETFTLWESDKTAEK